MSKIVNVENVQHALNVRAAIRNAVSARWPEFSGVQRDGGVARRAAVADAVSIYNAQMIAHAAQSSND